MDLNNIMRNIYGENASQNFDSLSLCGGKITYRRSNIKYLDEITTNPEVNDMNAEYSYKAGKIFSEFGDLISLSGGTKDDAKSNDSPTDVVGNPMLIDDAELQKFIKTFQLHYFCTTANKNGILVVPSKSTLDSMIKEYEEKLKEANIDNILSPAASKFASKSSLPFKNYLFDVYSSSLNTETPDNYHVPGDFPNTKPAGVLVRTNRLSNVYYFQFESKTSIKVATNENMKNASSLTLIGKSVNDVFVLKGDIPSASGATNTKGANVITLSGGNKSSNLRQYFMKLVRKYNNIDTAAYNFIGSFKDVSKISKYYSGDYVHAAFSIIADEKNAESFNIDANPDTEDVSETHSQLIDSYSPVKSQIKMNKVCDVLPRIFKNAKMAKNGLEASKTFVSTLHKMYNTTSAPPFMMKADIATAICKNSEGVQSVRNAFQIMDEMDALDSDHSNDNSYLNSTIKLSEKSTTSPLVNIIYNAISSSPFIGSLAREYTPMPLSVSRRSSIKPLSSFEDDKQLVHDNSDTFQFSILNEDSTTPSIGSPTDSTTDSTSLGSSPSQDNNDIDIKSFF